MTRLRMRVAERLKGAQNTYAMLTTFNEVDMTALMDMRNQYKVRRRRRCFGLPRRCFGLPLKIVVKLGGIIIATCEVQEGRSRPIHAS